MLSPFYPNVRLHLTLMLIYCYVFVMRTNYKLSSSSSLYECSSIGDDRHDWYHYYYYYYFCQYYIFIIPYSKIKSLNYYCYYHPLFFILSPLNYIDIILWIHIVVTAAGARDGRGGPGPPSTLPGAQDAQCVEGGTGFHNGDAGTKHWKQWWCNGDNGEIINKQWW